MKISYKIAAVALMFGYAVQANAQTGDAATASATASATIIAPIQITNNGDLDFGDIIATGTGGTVVLAVDGERTPSGVQLPDGGVQGVAAQFIVTGTGVYTYDITLPDTYSIQTGEAGASEIMEIDEWIHNSSETLTDGTETFSVGATLNLLPAQASGLYVGETPFSVSVNYN